MEATSSRIENGQKSQPSPNKSIKQEPVLQRSIRPSQPPTAMGLITFTKKNHKMKETPTLMNKNVTDNSKMNIAKGEIKGQ
ncbi:hypothetical protein J437_LFUL013812 [Ladona fulva]|uniref:Uncharacterized protein n=1 Tax=Ladona fulva TaxID=123851 RepID=A0A8K0P384_LADFU|nr:hypothetical protein J437_LFUL013812 [Ladona fulva]